MNVSLQLANEYSNVDLLAIPTEELLTRIGAQLGAVEEVIDWRGRFDGSVVAKVMSCTKHPNADKLHVCLVDDGGVTSDVERSKDGYVQVVCGAPNVRAGLAVVWLPPGATVPSTRDTEPFVLGARELRGVVSNGMLASAAELGISEDHTGILELPSDAKPGAAFGELYGLNDVVIDCENKMFTHRPDCFGVLGVARELAGICGQKFVSPDWYSLDVVDPHSPVGVLPFVSKNEVPSLVPRFMAQVIERINVKPSRVEIQTALARQGSRAINNIVDATNYYMHLTAQPTHAFDYDKVKALCSGEVTIFPRLAKDGETLQLLNGKTVTLTSSDIVIATDTQAIALAGVMGGAATEVDAQTKHIIVECATFDMYTIRRTSMRHGIFSDAVTRFNKGQSHLQNPVVLQKIVADICRDTGGAAGIRFDSTPEEDRFTQEPVEVTIDFINSRLGTSLEAEAVRELLENTEFSVDINETDIVVTPPFWRKDIELPEDIVEEVGRLHGFDALPVLLPQRSTAAAPRNALLQLQKRLRSQLSALGANEVLTYSFVSEKLIEAAGQNIKEAYQLSNALSPELQYYRLTLTPSLLGRVHQNLKAGYDTFALFEIGKTHLKREGVNEEGLPEETNTLGFVFATQDKSATKSNGAAYYTAKVYVEEIAKKFGLQLDYQMLGDVDYEIAKPYQPGRSALLIDRTSGNYIGIVGEFRSAVRRAFKVPETIAGFEILLAPLLALPVNRTYKPLAKFPGTTQDICFKVPLDMTYAQLENTVQQQLSTMANKQGYRCDLSAVDIFHKDKAKTNNVTMRIAVNHPERTLTTIEVNEFISKVADTVCQQLTITRV